MEAVLLLLTGLGLLPTRRISKSHSHWLVSRFSLRAIYWNPRGLWYRFGPNVP